MLKGRARLRWATLLVENLSSYWQMGGGATIGADAAITLTNFSVIEERSHRPYLRNQSQGDLRHGNVLPAY